MKRTPLYPEHEALGAHFVEFAGWEMPLYYESIISEHMAVRESAGIFDVSHMGEILLSGSGAAETLDMLSARQVSSVPVGTCVYTHFLDERGRIIDDTIITRLSSDEFIAVPNAATTERVFNWCMEHSKCDVLNVSSEICCIALQGPKSAEIMSALFPDAVNLRSFRALIMGKLPDKGSTLITRTGYTGEDGFEIFVNRERAIEIWREILKKGQPLGLKPAGLGARDSLRLEKCYLLSGTDFDGNQTTLETGYEWIITWSHDFIGKEALMEQKSSGRYMRLTPFRIDGRVIPRHGDRVLCNGSEGNVTSGGYSPVLKCPIAMGYFYPWPEAGSQVLLKSHGKEAQGVVVKPPFLTSSSR